LRRQLAEAGQRKSQVGTNWQQLAAASAPKIIYPALSFHPSAVRPDVGDPADEEEARP
jgi:hypothetical protein